MNYTPEQWTAFWTFVIALATIAYFRITYLLWRDGRMADVGVYYIGINESSDEINGEPFVSIKNFSKNTAFDVRVWSIFTTQDNVRGKEITPKSQFNLFGNTEILFEPQIEEAQKQMILTKSTDFFIFTYVEYKRTKKKKEVRKEARRYNARTDKFYVVNNDWDVVKQQEKQ